jgi:hypothetical protein
MEVIRQNQDIRNMRCPKRQRAFQSFYFLKLIALNCDSHKRGEREK